MVELEDASLMPYGKYKGFGMIDVPAYYLIWLLDNNRAADDVKQYTVKNEDALRKEIKENKFKN